MRARTAEPDVARAGLLISLPHVHLMRAYSYSDETGEFFHDCWSCGAQWQLFPTRVEARRDVKEVAVHVGEQHGGDNATVGVRAACKVEWR